MKLSDDQKKIAKAIAVYTLLYPIAGPPDSDWFLRLE